MALTGITWVGVGPLCGTLSFFIVFESPVWIFQQPENSMLGWGYVTTIPAVVAGLFVAGALSKLILKRWSLIGSNLHPFAIGAIQVVVAGLALGVLDTLGN